MLLNLLFRLILLSISYTQTSAHVALGNGLLAAEETVLPGSYELSTLGLNDTKIVPLRWFGQAFANGPNITIIGRDIDHIYHELKRRNPDFDIHNRQLLELQATAPAQTYARMLGTKHADGYTLCSRKQFRFASLARLREGIEYLRGINGFCIVDGPKGACNRASCSWNAGIWMCNDSTRGVTHQFMWCTDMAARAEQVSTDCQWSDPSRTMLPIANGQFFRTDTEYSVLLAGDDC